MLRRTYRVNFGFVLEFGYIALRVFLVNADKDIAYTRPVIRQAPPQDFDINAVKVCINSDDRYSYTLERLLTAADKHDLNVYIGTYDPKDWWKSDYDDEYISTLADVTNAVFKAVTARYSSHRSMKGWYFTPEMYVNDKGYEDAWAKLLNLTISGIERYGNNLPMIFSPYCNDYSSGCQTAAESFTRLLRKVNFRPSDVFAPQDGFGALKKDVSAAELSKRYDFVKSCSEAAKSADVNFWLNCELFTNSANEYASKNRMIGQFKLADVFCEKTICFSFAHYAFRPLDKTLFNDFKSILTN